MGDHRPKNTAKEVEVERIIIARNSYKVTPRGCSWLASASSVNLSRTGEEEASLSNRSGLAMQSRTACAMHAPAGVWAMKCAARLGRLALRKGEGEGEGFFSQTHVSCSNP